MLLLLGFEAKWHNDCFAIDIGQSSLHKADSSNKHVLYHTVTMLSNSVTRSFPLKCNFVILVLRMLSALQQ